jgi:hypothetical protein
MTTKTNNEPIYLGLFEVWGEEDIAVYFSHGVIYPVTDCCKASAKGTDGGTCCRSCYNEVDSLFGMGWTQEEFAEDIATGRVKQRGTVKAQVNS